MAYIDAYWSRVKHYGENYQDIALNSGIQDFAQFLLTSESTVRHLSTSNIADFAAVILENKEDENKVSQKMLAAANLPIFTGDIVSWGAEKWIVYYKNTRAYQPYNLFYIVRANYELKWIDDTGIIQSSWCHLVGQKDGKVKENFRTWHNTITPQANKYLEIILPLQQIRKYTEFIVDGEKWYSVEYDRISVPNILYMSCTETKANELTDDITNNLANADELITYTIEADDILATLGSHTAPLYSVYKNGVPDPTKTANISVSGDLVFEGGEILVNGEGTVTYSFTDENGTTITEIAQVSIVEEEQANFIIVGADNIKLDRSAEYVLSSPSALTNVAQFTINNTALATIVSQTNNSCVVRANASNKLGAITLTAVYDGNSYEKTINIISLWG